MQDNQNNELTVFTVGGPDDALAPVRGRAVRLPNALQTALADRYPDAVARLLGEAMIVGALVARSLKFDGRLVVQCHGTNEGAVSLLMADCTTDGHIRGYARYDAESLKSILLDNRDPGADALLGGGTFSMTIDQGPDTDLYQGLASVEGKRLSDCAEHFFTQSDQIPTQMRLAVGQDVGPDGPVWTGGGMMIQRVAEDKARGETDDVYATAKALMSTVEDAELIDPELPVERLLYRLFNEDGVRLLDTQPIHADCRCSRERLANTLRSFDAKAKAEMADADGKIRASCEFCNVEYVFDTEDAQPI
ncbi:Hsp33 family molecular chaperone HslO [Algimonas porphyrae]|uniref:33 kDa chaperonin n=1 Tax=Algimonas porphyrae TaxID=1128113 RepID=A0ABQ5UWV4_9PROT|nr:Hsp33 family molecular chaperone HslO [Algimonas porphyrae]GLQ19766.1 33 kDa chaperonin [Algimonas porphyrae]